MDMNMNTDIEGEISELEIDAGAFVTYFFEKALRTMETFTEHNDMDNVPDDIVLKCLKMEVMVNSKRENANKEIRKHKKGLIKEINRGEKKSGPKQSSPNLFACKKEDLDDDDVNEKVNRNGKEKVNRNGKKKEKKNNTKYCGCEMCSQILSVDTYWNTWKPNTKMEIILQKNIEKIENNFR
tara:strand:- start:535 stop:1080 length:546 start_codon:yes stop_codon:yes gene_type:complete